MPTQNGLTLQTIPRDIVSGLVVFLVAVPLCLGVALASGAPLFSGLLAGIIGGILVGAISGSQSSVSGPAAGLTAVVAAQIAVLGSFEAFLLALCIAGVFQIILGVVKAGFIAEFFPSSVIKGLLAAIGVILILKQVPHLLGHDADPVGDMAFNQRDNQNTLSELIEMFDHVHLGALVVGLVSIALMVVWEKCKALKRSPVPAPLAVVLTGVAMSLVFGRLGGEWIVEPSQLVQVPVAESLSGFFAFLQWPDFSQIANPAIYTAAFTIAAVASLETLLNLEAVDKLDPQQRTSPPSRELLAQGIGNLAGGLIGAIPITSVIVRSSVNIDSGGKTKLATIVHGTLLLVSVTLFPLWLNMIPLSALAAILMVTGFKLVSPSVVKRMWSEGRYQFVPFVVTVVAIVLTDLLVGVLIGLAVSISFILNSNVRRPLSEIVEKQLGGDVLHVQLANQVSFLNRAALLRIFNKLPRGGKLLLNAHASDYIDPDILDLIRDYKEKTAPARGVELSLVGFRKKYRLQDQIEYTEHATRDLQSALTPAAVLEILKDGNHRFRSGQRLTRNFIRQVDATAEGQHPMAVILSCIDSRTPAELIFDLGVGDVFSVRVAGNVLSRNVIGSIEYGCAVAGSKLIVVMGHSRCGAVTATVDLCCNGKQSLKVDDCEHLNDIVAEITRSIDQRQCKLAVTASESEKRAFVDDVSRLNVMRVVQQLRQQSRSLENLVREGTIAIVGAMYNVASGEVEFLGDAETLRSRSLVRPRRVPDAFDKA